MGADVVRAAMYWLCQSLMTCSYLERPKWAKWRFHMCDGGGGRSAVLMVKSLGMTAYEPLEAKPQLARSDRVVWKWRSAKRVFAFAVVGDVRSERVVIRAR